MKMMDRPHRFDVARHMVRTLQNADTASCRHLGVSAAWVPTLLESRHYLGANTTWVANTAHMVASLDGRECERLLLLCRWLAHIQNCR